MTNAVAPSPPQPAHALLQRSAAAPADCLPGIFLLPGGYVDESGKVHDEVELAPLTGLDESMLANLDPQICAASVVTALLARCIKRIGSLHTVDASLVSELLVADRDYLIVMLRRLTLGPKVDCVLQCSDPNCGKLMDLMFSVDELEFERRPVEQRYVTINLRRDAEGLEAEGSVSSVEIRFPNGADQEDCAPLFLTDKEAAVTKLLSRCIRRIDDCLVVDSEKVAGLGQAKRLELEERLGQLAPDVEIEIQASCLECQRSLDLGFDLLSFFLKELLTSIRNVERDVHYLAWHYHWSESEILAMSRQKRRRYVALVQQEVDGLNQVW